MTSSRKKKARLKDKMKELVDKNANSSPSATPAESIDLQSADLTDIQSFDKETMISTLNAIRDGILEGLEEGFKEEFDRASDVDREALLLHGDYFKDIIAGIKEGMNQQIKEFTDETSDPLIGTISNLHDMLEKSLAPLKDMTALIEENSKPDKTAPKHDSEKTDKRPLVINPTTSTKAMPKRSMAGKTADFALDVIGGSFGIEKFIDRYKESRNEKLMYVQTEKELRAKEFEGKSDRQIDKALKKEYKAVNKERAKVKEIDDREEALKERGYTPLQTAALSYNTERRAAVSRLQATGSSKYVVEEGPGPTDEEEQQERDHQQRTFHKESVEAEQTQSDSLAEISDAQERTNELLEKISNNSSGGLLGAGGSLLGSLGGMLKSLIPGAGALGGAKAAGKGSSILKYGKSALKLAPAAIASYAIANTVDAGASALGVGGNEIDEEQDDKNWERASITEKMESSVARGIEHVGRFLGFDSFANEAEAARIEKETAYLDEKAKSITTPPSATDMTPVTESIGEEIGKNIVVRVPPPTVVNQGQGKEIIPQPFTNHIKNNEPSVSDYLRSRYAT